MQMNAALTPLPGSAPVQDKILVVDDEPLVRELLSNYLCSAGYACETAATGREALDRLNSSATPIPLVIADIRMPELNGLELLDRICSHYPETAAIMITAVADVNTAIGTMKQGAYDYITKPFNLEAVAQSVENALNRRNSQLRVKRTSRDLEKMVQEKTSALMTLMGDLDEHCETTLDILMKVLDARGHETQCHSQRVEKYTLRLADEMEFPEHNRVDLARGALLHDIGKIGIPDSILLKPSKLTPEEWNRMKEHTTIGYRIFKGVKFLGRVAEMVLSHHERYDGQGYPRALRGEQIPIEARMFAILDAYDAMTSRRPYRDAQTVAYAAQEIRDNAGKQFDPKLVEYFLRIPAEAWMEIGDQYREGTGGDTPVRVAADQDERPVHS